MGPKVDPTLQRLAMYIGPTMDRLLGRWKLVAGGALLVALSAISLSGTEVISPSLTKYLEGAISLIFGVGIVHLGVNRARERAEQIPDNRQEE